MLINSVVMGSLAGNVDHIKLA